MDRSVKIFLAFCVLLGGVGAAMLFRHPSPRAKAPAPSSEDLLVLRQPSGSREAESVAARQPAGQRGPSDMLSYPPVSGRSARNLPSTNPEEPPPRLARDYPRFYDQAVPAEHATTSGGLSGAERVGGVRTHKIVDGDTLRGLANRYLGDAGRALEIYEVNRDVLPSPEVLPIGADLKIPSRQKPIPPSPEPASERQLVPVLPAR